MFGNMGKMLKLAGEMKTKLPAIKEELAATEHRAEAGDGRVAAVVNGKMRLVKVEFADDLLADPALTAETLGDLVTTAVRDAQIRAADAAAEKMRELTGGVDIPGFSDML